MQNFRKDGAYQVSLYLLLLALIFVALALLPTNFGALFLFPVPILFLVALFLRFISLDSLKRWVDINFIFLAVILLALQAMLAASPDECGFYNQFEFHETVPIPQWTPRSMFDACSPHNILNELQIATAVFILISLILVIKFLIPNIKRRRAVVGSI